MDGIVLEVARDDHGRVVFLHPVDPDTVFAVPTPNDLIKYVQVIDGKVLQTFGDRDLLFAKIGKLP